MRPLLIIYLLLSPTLLALDRDSDGLDDIWQWIYTAQDLLPNEDADHDGRTNLEECQAGTDPNDPTSYLGSVSYSIEVTDAELSVSWETQEGKIYRVHQDEVLSQPGWGNQLAGTGKTFTLVINNDGSGQVIQDKGGEHESIVDSTYHLNEPLASSSRRFFSISVQDTDSDSDGVNDWAENRLKPFINLDPTLPQTNAGVDDADFVSDWYDTNASITPEITLVATDRCAFENNAPLEGEDNAEITITRTGILPITVPLSDMGVGYTSNTSVICNGQCCIVVGVAGDEAVETDDYQFYDEAGNELTDTQVTFELGQTERKITVKAIDDSVYEYPETLNLAAVDSTDATYTLSATNGASLQLLDAPDEPENEVIFVGGFSQDGRATVTTDGTGYMSARLNGSRTELLITSSFSNLTSPQQDCHVHKSNPGSGPTPGSIVYAITETPYDELTDPLNGPLSDYPWDITESPGAVPTAGGGTSRQVIIDSLFSQNGETPLYLNIHTVSNPAGEIWSFLAPTTGSSTAPGDPIAASLEGSTDFPILTGLELEREVRRFLDQATFGASPAQVEALLETINTARVNDPTYHRNRAFEDWITAQINMEQTYHLDFLTADTWQLYKIGGYFDPTRNLGYTDPNTGEVLNPPTEPATWPSVDRSNPDPEKWHMTLPYPITNEERKLATTVNSLQAPTDNMRRVAAYTIYQGADDQLRQKFGYAIQQILLVSAITGEIENQLTGYANYIDMLNAKSFTTFRDLLGYVNNSPIMGNWLTSLMNQREADLDGDTVPDVFADENLARENMQLFSIGLFETWEDGSLKLDETGRPIPTYTNADITEFAKIITGQSYGKNIEANEGHLEWGGKPYDQLKDNSGFNKNLNQTDHHDLAYLYPMAMFPDYHDQSPVKTIVGGKQITNFSSTGDGSDATLKALAEKDLSDAMDWLAGKPNDGQPDFDGINSHGSTPAFICRRLIQRLVTSNPSQDYLHRVSRAFIDSEGDMAVTVKAILLDPAARVLDATDYSFGHKKNPLEAYMQINRKLQAITGIPLQEADTTSFPFQYLLGDFSSATNPDLYLTSFDYPTAQLDNFSTPYRYQQNSTITSARSGLQIQLHEQETVFNWYLPDYSPGGVITAASLVAPEMQLLTDTTLTQNINYFNLLSRGFAGNYTDTRLKGVPGRSLGNKNENQRIAFGLDPSVETDADRNDYTQLPILQLADQYYPQTAIADTAERTGESLADEALVDALDTILTYGLLKEKYPYDPTDNDDPLTPEVDETLKNPRECIIDAIGYWGNPWNVDATKAHDSRADKVADALWMIISTPEFMIQK